MKRLLECLAGRTVDRRPAWIMRQAGRYLPEYRRTRAKAGSFLALCKTPELACEVSLQPLKRFPQLDAVIIFSDILTIPDAMGLGLEFIEGSGPRFRRPLREAADIDALAVPDVHASLAYTAQAVAAVSHAMDADKTLIGFCGSPWTIACYMCSNDKAERIQHTLDFIHRENKAFHKLLSMLAAACADYLCLQVESGAEAVQIFDSWGGHLREDYSKNSLFYISKTLDMFESGLRERGLSSVPVILYTQAEEQYYGALADCRIDALSVPHGRSLSGLHKRFGNRLVLQGNLDPLMLAEADADDCARATRAVLEDFGTGDGHIFNLGHGITPQAKVENVNAVLEQVCSW
ncbi:MAG: uroporphyrinogen decarboxylase [Gammaproteobacteria bacterium]|nr:uroporphyrinogen decarboxylase [Pseudomonadota bacterium]MCH9663534.1 uroporphyrinogen decarboxylase [Gammaproteobacteria bacterium]